MATLGKTSSVHTGFTGSLGELLQHSRMGDHLIITNEQPMEETRSLRIITYLLPSLPIEYFSLLVEYLESKLKRQICLMVETRAGGPLSDRPDPFSANEADIGIISSAELHKLLQRAKGFVDLIPAAPVFAHAGTNNRPVYFSDVIIHKDNREKYKEFRLLHGAKWAFSHKASVSSYIRPLYELKRMGQNANFFTKVIESGSHTKSVDMVLNQTVDGAAVDSVSLGMQMKMNSAVRDNLIILKSWGPITAHPMVINTRLSKELQQQITDCLMNIHEDVNWRHQFGSFNLTKFLPVSIETYREDDQVKKDVSEMRLESAVYY